MRSVFRNQCRWPAKLLAQTPSRSRAPPVSLQGVTALQGTGHMGKKKSMSSGVLKLKDKITEAEAAQMTSRLNKPKNVNKIFWAN